MPHKRWLRIVPVAVVMYAIAFINRTNVSLALPILSRDLHMNPVQEGMVAGVFFWGYLLLQVPGGHLAQRWSAKWFVSILLVFWGITGVACGLVRTWQELWLARLLLGVSESGMYPASVMLFSHWFPRSERARALAIFSLALPISLIVSSPFSGWVLDQWNWRVMLMIEGSLPFVWLAVWIAAIDDHPRHAKWISPAERDYLERTLDCEAESDPANDSFSFRKLLHPRVLLLACVSFSTLCGQLGFLFWLPSVLQKAKNLSGLAVGILFTLPFIVAGISMILNSWHSDKSGDRRLHVAIPLALGGLFLFAGVLVSERSQLLAFVFICLSGVGTFAPLGPFWAIPTETFSRKMAGAVTGLVNAIGNLGGYFGPLLVGYVDKRTGNFRYGFGALAIIMLFGSILALMLKRATRRVNASAAATGH